MASPVMDLPAPDSPTTPRISPGRIDRLTSDSAVTVPRRPGKSTRRLRTSMTGSWMSPICVPLYRIAGREDCGDRRIVPAPLGIFGDQPVILSLRLNARLLHVEAGELAIQHGDAAI